MIERVRIRLAEAAGMASIALRLHSFASRDNLVIEPDSLLAAELVAVARTLVPTWQQLDPAARQVIRDSLAAVVPARLVDDLDAVIDSLALILATEIECEQLHDELPETP